MAIKITCIKKDNGHHENPHVAISSLSWINESTSETGTTSRVDMYEWVKNGGVAYVRDSKGDVAYLIAETTSFGTKFVRTRPDGTKADNLLSLPECR
ncbi:MAG TPA: DUF3892 domain-containing protein [Chitinophagales bacterium]|nr:DUF3892 domain-containing protein [Chitinophagales bacterium]